MDWSELLKRDIEYTYTVTDKLMALVDEKSLNWKPSTGANWMTVGQLLMHLATTCTGAAFKGFATGDWGLPEGMDMKEMSPEDMLPPAEKLPSISSVAEARKQLAKDKQLALDTLARCSEKQLNTAKAPAPWDPTEMILGHRLLQMVNHLAIHKAQLFYYLKLQGKPVNTGHLWGM